MVMYGQRIMLALARLRDRLPEQAELLLQGGAGKGKAVRESQLFLIWASEALHDSHGRK